MDTPTGFRRGAALLLVAALALFLAEPAVAAPDRSAREGGAFSRPSRTDFSAGFPFGSPGRSRGRYLANLQGP